MTHSRLTKAQKERAASRQSREESPLPLGVLAVGAAVPCARLDVAEVVAAWGASAPFQSRNQPSATLAVCGSDEDSLTLAWHAGTAALEAGGLAGSDLGGVWWGCARPPFAEGPSWSYLVTALGAGEATVGGLLSGSVHAGADALGAAWHAVASKAVGASLVVVSDALTPGLGTVAERTTGAGSVALLVGPVGDECPVTVRRFSVASRPLLDRYRGDSQSTTRDPYDFRLYREQELIPLVRAALASFGRVASAARWSVPDPDGKLGRVIARAIGAEYLSSDGLQRRIGDTGSASMLLGALDALQEPGPLMVVAAGGGRASMWEFWVEGALPGVTAAIQQRDQPGHLVGYPYVLRSRGQLVPHSDPVAMGVPPGSAAFVRGNEEILGLLGRRCRKCGYIAVPPSVHPVCPSCGNSEAETVRLARAGRIHTFVVNQTMPPPFEAPLPLCVVDLDDGARVMLQGVAEDAPELAIGDRVTVELRRYATERNAPVYGFKVLRDK